MRKIFTHIELIPAIIETSAQSGDIQIGESYISHFCEGRDARTDWWCLIYRPSTGEVFKIYCWDGLRGSHYYPILESGMPPSGSTICGCKLANGQPKMISYA